MKWTCLVPAFKYQLSFVHNEGNDFYFVTNKEAPNYKVVRTRVDASKAKSVEHVTQLSDEAVYEDVIAERKDAPISDAAVIHHNKLLLVYSIDVKNELWQFELETGRQVVQLLPDCE